MELGGKSANIIFEDAPIDQAVEGVVNGIFFNQGHVCCAGSRLFVQESVADMVIQKVKDRLDTLYVGNPLDKNTDIGAINSKAQMETILKYIEIGKNEGADIYESKCSIPKKETSSDQLCLLMWHSRVELLKKGIFGPVLSVQSFHTIDEVIQSKQYTFWFSSWCLDR